MGASAGGREGCGVGAEATPGGAQAGAPDDVVSGAVVPDEEVPVVALARRITKITMSARPGVVLARVMRSIRGPLGSGSGGWTTRAYRRFGAST